MILQDLLSKFGVKLPYRLKSTYASLDCRRWICRRRIWDQFFRRLEGEFWTTFSPCLLTMPRSRFQSALPSHLCCLCCPSCRRRPRCLCCLSCRQRPSCLSCLSCRQRPRCLCCSSSLSRFCSLHLVTKQFNENQRGNETILIHYFNHWSLH